MSDSVLTKAASKTKILEEQQLYAYTNFINYTLIEEPFVSNILTDLKDGLILIRFLTNLSGKEILKTIETPSKDIEKIQNLGAVIQFAKDEGIKVLTSAEEIFNGEKKGILSFMYQILSKYRLGNCPVKMIDFTKWIKSILKIEDTSFDLKKELSEGILFAKLINYLQNDLINLTSFTDNHLENIQRCIDIAYQRLNIPKLIKAEFVEKNTVDDYCLYFYLTFFIMKENVFDDNEVMETIAQGIRERNAQLKMTLKNRIGNSLRRMLDCSKSVRIVWPNLDDPSVPEEAKNLGMMSNELEEMLSQFEQVSLTEDESNIIDLNKDPVMIDLKHWEESVNKKNKEIKMMEKELKIQKRNTLPNSQTPRLDEKERMKENRRTISPRMMGLGTELKQNKEVEEKNRKIEELQKNLELEQEQKNQLKEKLEEQENQIERMKEEINKEKEEFEKNNEKNNNTINEMKSIFELEKKEKDEEITKLKSSIEEQTIKIEQTQLELKKLEELKIESEKQNEIKKQEIERLNKELEFKDTEHERRSKENELSFETLSSSLNKKIEDLERSEKLMDEKIQKLEKENISKEEENNSLKKQIEEEQSVQQQTLRECDELRKVQIDILSSSTQKDKMIQDYQNEISRIKQELETEKENRKSQESFISEMKKENEKIQSEKEELLSKISDEQKLKDEIKRLTEVVEQYKLNQAEDETDRKVLFNSLALAIKIVVPNRIIEDNTMLYEECMKEHVPINNWNMWLIERLTKE
ncbi:cortexillin, putative [Entamoeba histolytica HM-3:IMSS]|uniref:Cortexillin, putative n=2 Tax=Entamoeba histolytica TaxID=5759 RepID=M2R1G6_ENTHI|nr:cortexillin, putative [Entamoeba histolytica KU27]EMS12979.1 cortexillin, putative [Entamoeba histolytica HM-3:IMSS]